MENVAKIECEIKKGVSKKNGKPYVMVSIPLGQDCDKVVFLTAPESALLKLTYDF